MKKALLYNWLLSGGGVTPPSPEAQLVFDNIETGSGELLTDPEKTAISRFVDELHALGRWDEIYSFIPFSGLATSAKARVDWKTGVIATLHGAGLPTYNSATGLTTNGTNGYIDSKVNPATINGGGTVLLNDSGYAIHGIQNLGVCNMGVIGTNANGQVQIRVTSAGVNAWKHHTDATIAFTNATYFGLSDDLYMIPRTASNLVLRMKDGQNYQNATQVSEVVPAGRTIFVGAINNNGTAIDFGASSYGTFMVYKASTFRYDAFFAHWEIMLMELGVKTKTTLYPLDINNTYSTADAMILNSEGQSNSMFAGAASGPPTPSELADPITGTYAFTRLNFANPLTIDVLDYGVNNSYDVSGLTKFASGLRASFEIVQRQNLKPYLWFYGIGGKALTILDVDGWYPDLPAKLFVNSHSYIGIEGIPLITETLKKIVFHWGQGEADAGLSRTTAQYRADFFYYLTKKIDFLEAQGINLTNTKLHAVVPKIWSGLNAGTYITRDQIRTAQDQFTVANFESDYPAYTGKVTSFTVYNNDKLIHTDGVHIDATGYLIEGYRLGMYISRL